MLCLGWNYDSSGHIISPDGGVVGVFDYYASKPRRKMNEVVRNFPCPVENCGKLYSTEQIAKTHMRKYHPGPTNIALLVIYSLSRAGIEIPKRIDPLPNPDEEYTHHDFSSANFQMYTPDLQSVMQSQQQPQSAHGQQGAYHVRSTPTPQLRTQPYNPNLAYSFTTIPTTNFFAALTQNQPQEGPAPSSTPFDWNQLNRYISNTLAGERLDHASEQQQEQHGGEQHEQQQQQPDSGTNEHGFDNSAEHSQNTFDSQQGYEQVSHGDYGTHEQQPVQQQQHVERPRVFADQSSQHTQQHHGQALPT